MHVNTADEFFSAVRSDLEPAVLCAQQFLLLSVARLHGSYEALEGGWTEDALVDFTGGVGYRYDLTQPSKIPEDCWDRLLHDISMNSMLGAAIHVSER